MLSLLWQNPRLFCFLKASSILVYQKLSTIVSSHRSIHNSHIPLQAKGSRKERKFLSSTHSNYQNVLERRNIGLPLRARETAKPRHSRPVCQKLRPEAQCFLQSMSDCPLPISSRENTVALPGLSLVDHKTRVGSTLCIRHSDWSIHYRQIIRHGK
jgi:hypothetical protein